MGVVAAAVIIVLFLKGEGDFVLGLRLELELGRAVWYFLSGEWNCGGNFSFL